MALAAGRPTRDELNSHLLLNESKFAKKNLIVGMNEEQHA
jgi:hypothetical protein